MCVDLMDADAWVYACDVCVYVFEWCDQTESVQIPTTTHTKKQRWIIYFQNEQSVLAFSDLFTKRIRFFYFYLISRAFITSKMDTER